MLVTLLLRVRCWPRLRCVLGAVLGVSDQRRASVVWECRGALGIGGPSDLVVRRPGRSYTLELRISAVVAVLAQPKGDNTGLHAVAAAGLLLAGRFGFYG
jgi:hypothetical protein